MSILLWAICCVVAIVAIEVVYARNIVEEIVEILEEADDWLTGQEISRRLASRGFRRNSAPGHVYAYLRRMCNAGILVRRPSKDGEQHVQSSSGFHFVLRFYEYKLADDGPRRRQRKREEEPAPLVPAWSVP